METDLLTALIGSTVIATSISTTVAFIQAKRIQHADFRNSYFKQIIAKRTETYEYLERFLNQLRPVAVHTTGEIHHKFFEHLYSNPGRLEQVNAVLDRQIWLEPETSEIFTNMYAYVSVMSHERAYMDNFFLARSMGKEIEAIRKKLEQAVSMDLLNLYNVQSFMEKKRTAQPTTPTIVREIVHNNETRKF